MFVSERGVPILVLVAACVAGAHGFIDGLYCGRENCYEVLGVGRDTSKAEMARAYRQLARKHHPDMHKTQEAKSRATERFTLIATAYEILKDDESRKDYDDMLDNPEAVYRHYFRYYRKRMAPRVDVRIVLAVTITVISVVQYYGAWHRYRTAIDHLVTVPKYRLKAVEIARADGFYNPSRKRDRRRKVSAAPDPLRRTVLWSLPGGAEGRGGEPAPEDHRGAGGHPGRLQQAQLAAGAVGAAGAAARHPGPPGLVAGPLAVQVHPGGPGAGSRGEGVPDQAPHGPLPGAVGRPRGPGAPGLPQGPALAQGQVQGVEAAAGGGDEGQAGRERPLQELPALHEEPRPRPDQLRGLTLRPINYFLTLGRAGAATPRVPPTLRGLRARPCLETCKRSNRKLAAKCGIALGNRLGSC
ncbi:unnamed protein product [Ixodes persulcatus]